MAIIVLTSAGGSPGVTSTALGLSLTWPRPVLLADCDLRALEDHRRMWPFFRDRRIDAYAGITRRFDDG